MNKYYTPEIGEFCVGFRFEFLNPTPNIANQEVWRKMEINAKVFREWMRNNLIYKGVQGDHFRVKHLDQEDIEELGWKLDQCTGKDGCYFYLKDKENSFEEYKLNLWGREHKYISEFNLDISHSKKGELFDGNIKNYNELKKLMNQLGI